MLTRWLLASVLLCACGGSPRAADEPAACVEHRSGEPPAGCNFVVEHCCYADQAAACAAAGCSEAGCLVLESYPAQIQCQ